MICSCKKMPIFYRELCRSEMTCDLLKMLETIEKRIKGSKGGRENRRKKRKEKTKYGLIIIENEMLSV